MASRLQIAKPDILRYFDELPGKVLTRRELGSILREQRTFWRLAASTTFTAFVKFLRESGRLHEVRFPFPYRPEVRYVWGEVPLLEVLQTVREKSYFTHFTAMRLNGLTEQLPKTIYLNHEQRPHNKSANTTLEQSAVDNAFKAPQRISNNVIELESTRICLLNGMWTDNLGVQSKLTAYDTVEPAFVRFTDVERTLIDITVRPVYAGGVFDVARAYEAAKADVSINRLLIYLRKLDFVYPYHQAIGYYLERAGYSAELIEPLREFPMSVDFYLTHRMGQATYSPRWRLFVPKGF